MTGSRPPVSWVPRIGRSRKSLTRVKHLRGLIVSVEESVSNDIEVSLAYIGGTCAVGQLLEKTDPI